MAIEGVLEKGFVTTSADALINWARNGSMWPMSFGLDLDRGLEPIVDAGPDVPADLRPRLRLPRLVRIVGRDVARGDIRVLADLGVADVGEVRHLRASADVRVLDLDERARLRTRAEFGTRP